MPGLHSVAAYPDLYGELNSFFLFFKLACPQVSLYNEVTVLKFLGALLVMRVGPANQRPVIDYRLALISGRGSPFFILPMIIGEG